CRRMIHEVRSPNLIVFQVHPNASGVRKVCFWTLDYSLRSDISAVGNIKDQDGIAHVVRDIELSPLLVDCKSRRPSELVLAALDHTQVSRIAFRFHVVDTDARRKASA